MWYQVWLGKDLVSFGEEFNHTNVDMDALYNINLPILQSDDGQWEIINSRTFSNVRFVIPIQSKDKGIWKGFEIYLLDGWKTVLKIHFINLYDSTL